MRPQQNMHTRLTCVEKMESLLLKQSAEQNASLVLESQQTGLINRNYFLNGLCCKLISIYKPINIKLLTFHTEPLDYCSSGCRATQKNEMQEKKLKFK